MSSQALIRTVETPANTQSGMLMLLACLLVFSISGFAFSVGINAHDPIVLTIAGLLFFGFLFISCGFYTLQANEAAAVTLFGKYVGTDRNPGLRWVLPPQAITKISLRARNVTGEKLKVNDRRGNPIEIAAVVVWRVTDSAAALFDVDVYQKFVDVQIETALREIASHFAYDNAEHDEPTLRAASDQVSALLREKLQDRVSIAGVVVDEAKLSHLAYAPEIASLLHCRNKIQMSLLDLFCKTFQQHAVRRHSDLASEVHDLAALCNRHVRIAARREKAGDIFELNWHADSPCMTLSAVIVP